jgi:hypothetical protein
MSPSEPETVEAARQRVIDWAGTWDEDELPDIELREDLARFEAAVRRDERQRAATAATQYMNWLVQRQVTYRDFLAAMSASGGAE